jgi:excisionase family DNA binding protein
MIQAADNPPLDDRPALMTAAETIAFLRLDAGGGNANERLRNLIRRNRLPVIRRGRLKLFRREAVDAWLAAGERGGRR